jgi:hypothetical protein
MGWIDLAQDKDMAGCCDCGNELSSSLKLGERISF